MPLSVLSVAYPLAPVGPDAVGGAEQVLGMIDEGLVRAGHRSLVVACEGSHPRGTLIATPAHRGPLDSLRERAWEAHRAAIDEVLGHQRVDLVHFHGLDFPNYLPPSLACAALATLHLPPSWYAPEVFSLPARGIRLHCVSASQRSACPEGAELLETIPNGVPLDRLLPAACRGSFLTAIGRICPEKGFHLALEAARRANLPLLLAGEVFSYEAHQRYFREEIAPRLDSSRRFIGPVGPRAKRRLLSRARALLVPSLVPETSSLAAMEALACGTPVVAFRHGALPEIVEHGRTGFLVDGVDGIQEALPRLGEIDPRECRARAEERFSAESMVARYLSMYEQLVTEHRPRRDRRGGRQRVEILTEPAQLAAIQSEWRKLWHRVPDAPPFVHPDWLLPWCRHFGRVRVLATSVWEGERMVGLAPMEIWREGDARVLKLLGSGVSDALDALVDPSDEAGVVRALDEAWQRERASWDLCELAPLRAHSPLVRAEVPGWEPATPCEVSPALDLQGVRSLDDLASGSVLRNIRDTRRRLHRAGSVSVERAEAASASGLIEKLVSLHAERWRLKGGSGVLGDDAVQAFHRDVVRRFAREGMLRLVALRLDGRVVGVLYGFAAHGRCNVYLMGFDPKLRKLSLGTVLIAEAIEDARAAGDRCFDFLRGGEPYKYAWGARDVPLFRRMCR